MSNSQSEPRFVKCSCQHCGGHIEFDASYQGTPHAAHYAATKAYVQTLAEGLYVELARKAWMFYLPRPAR